MKVDLRLSVRIFLLVSFYLVVNIVQAGGMACNQYYLSPSLRDKTDVNRGMGFQLLRTDKYIGSLAQRGDRIIVRLSPDLSKQTTELMSPEGIEAMDNFMHSIDPAQVLKHLANDLSVPVPNLNDLISVHGDAQIREMFEARNNEDWNKIIEIYDTQMTEGWKQVSEAKLQMALALNRRNKGQDRGRAILISNEVIAISSNRSLLSEAYGILARIYKDQYNQLKTKMPNSALVNELFTSAITTYKKGFSANPFDYYPGIAALNMMVTRPDKYSASEIKSYAWRVQLAVNTSMNRFREQDQSPDFWLLATALELNVYRQDWNSVQALLPQLLAASAGPHTIKSQIATYTSLKATWSTQAETDPSTLDNLDRLLSSFKNALHQPNRYAPADAISPSYVSNLSFPNMEGAFSTKSYMLKAEIEESGIAAGLREAAASAPVNVMTFHKFLQQNQSADSTQKSVLLAPTGPYRSVIKTISDLVKMSPWWNAYKDLGLPLDAAHSERFIEGLLQSGQNIYLLVPKNFRDVHLASFTYEEYKIILKHLPVYSKQIHFVFGFENTFPLDWSTRISESEVRLHYRDNVMMYFTQTFQKWLKKLGDNVKNYDL